jgi:hypothetical protein
MVVAVDDGSFHLEILVLGALSAVAFVALFLFVAYPPLVRQPPWRSALRKTKNATSAIDDGPR